MKKMNRQLLSVGAVGAVALSACGMIEIPFAENGVVEEARVAVAGKEPSLLPTGTDWKLVWRDEFDAKEIDRSKWLCRESFWGCDFPAFAHDFRSVGMTGETEKLKVLRRGRLRRPHAGVS